VTAAAQDRASFDREWQEWRQARDLTLRGPHGFLAITALHWPAQVPERYEDVPGAWSAGDEGARVSLAEGEELVVEGEPVHGEFSFGVICERGERTATFGDAMVEVARQGGRYLVRARHPEHRRLVDFTGTPAYPPDPGWVVTGRFVAFGTPREVTVGSVVEGLEHAYVAPGQVEIELGGEIFRLTAFNGTAPGDLLVLFNDATSGVTTGTPNRVLFVDAPDGRGAVTLDFNRACNLMYVYTDFATCPRPPAENRLPIAVEAGEQAPIRHRELPLP
jgi:uncharacterized protein (DUF1684 family)